MPKDGPETGELLSKPAVQLPRTSPTIGYALVSLSPQVVDVANATSDGVSTFSQLPRGSGGKDIRIGVGDLLSVTIYESQPGGLFSPPQASSSTGNSVAIPNQQVDVSGNIDVPYAGAVRVAGRTPRQVSTEIAGKLANRAIEPQVIVSVADRRGSDVNVLGDVLTPQRFPLDPGGINVLGAIARAGGPKDPDYETVVTIQRGSRTVRAPLTTLIRNASENVGLAPGDVVYVARDPRVFVALGATPSPGSVGGINNRRFVFDNVRMSLTEAVAKAGGLAPDRADPGAVFVFRLESRRALASMGVDVRSYTQDLVPTIYAADWRQSDAFFLANAFSMRDKDVIFVSEHPVADIEKFTTVLRGFTSSGADAGVIAEGLR